MTEMSAAAQDRSKEESDHSLRTGVLVGLVVFAVGVAMAGVWVFALKKYRKYHEVAKKDDSEVVPEEKIVWRKDTPRPSLLKGFSP